MAAREPVPDEENSALVVAEVVSMLPGPWPADPPPPPGMPKPPPSEFMLAFDLIATTESNVLLDDERAATLREGLEAYPEAVELARTIADYARGQHEIELTPALIDVSLQETQDARTVVRWLEVDAAIRAQDGDLDGAVDSCRAILGVCRSIGDEPFLISGFVRIAMGTIAMMTTRRVLAQGEPSEAALARLQADVLAEAAEPLLLRGYRGERAGLDEIIRRVGHSEIPIVWLSRTASPDDPIPPVAPWGKLMFDSQRAVGLEWMNTVVSIARQPPYERAPLLKAWEAEMDRVKNSRLGTVAATLPLLMMPPMTSAASADGRFQGELGAMAILLAAERHRRKTGDWPDSGDEIDPAFLPERPVDPLTGRPFVVERGDGQILVHSVGPNLEDEHGAYEPRKWMSGELDDVGTRAWVVRLRRRPPPE
jgi:hypothetical protein